jgi:hypothetical protein
VSRLAGNEPYRRATILGALVILAATTGPVYAQDRIYNRPRHNDLLLDWCLTWGSNCGRPVAMAFCNRRRYEDVGIFREYRTEGSEPTSLMGTNQICRGACSGFAYIQCLRQIPHNRVFANPKWDLVRLDVCREWGANCGKPAADAFCRAKGFSDAFNAAPDPEPGRSSTRVISSGQICQGTFCTGFQQIICR